MRTLGILLAIVLHVALLLFGGIFLLNDKEKAAREELVDIAVEEEPPQKKPEEEKPEEKPEEKKDETPEETPQFVAAPMPDQLAGPALSQLSLSDLESLASGIGGAGGFGGGGLSTGGVAGGSGGGEGGEGILNGGQLDQKPKLIDRVDPKPPGQLAKSLPQVTVTVFMDSNGRVTRADVFPVVAPLAQKAILDALMRWKYEPGQRGGKKVASKVSHKISFN